MPNWLLPENIADEVINLSHQYHGINSMLGYLQKYADQLGVKLTTAQMKKIAAFKEIP